MSKTLITRTLLVANGFVNPNDPNYYHIGINDESFVFCNLMPGGEWSIGVAKIWTDSFDDDGEPIEAEIFFRLKYKYMETLFDLVKQLKKQE